MALKITLPPGIFLLYTDISNGVMITDSCTMNAVFELVVPLSASMQKILLNIQKQPILIPMMNVFLLILMILLKKIMEIVRNPPRENMNRIVKYGRYPRSIFDHMYEDPHRIAFSNRKTEAFRSFIIFICTSTSFFVTIIFNSFAIFIANPA